MQVISKDGGISSHHRIKIWKTTKIDKVICSISWWLFNVISQFAQNASLQIRRQIQEHSSKLFISLILNWISLEVEVIQDWKSKDKLCERKYCWPP